MKPHLKSHLNNLFANTSAFAQQSLAEQPQSPPLMTGVSVFAHTEQILDLISDAIGAIEDNHPEEALDAIEAIRDLVNDR